ncbi:RNA polymerase sigma factor [Kordiimonas sp. UBA4487]|jgi:RNA polymerase sigma-70 factor (ECF subfamily)|uniref:RNA polymerase sigma factor n=1 Tax=Kordiimonas sp. UBA4487 TaxID=1946675 RepID=UPI002579CE8F|nr:RNA polymerase sigma factor [Kordiimonas sp. UBA4487]
MSDIAKSFDIWNGWHRYGGAEGAAFVRATLLDTGTKSILLEAFLEKRPALKRFLVARFRDETVADDLLQDLYLKLERIEDASAISNVGAYLFRMANNVALDHRRQKTRQMARDKAWVDVSRADQGGESVDEGPAADRAIEAKQKLAQVSEALKQLPPQCRKVFVLHKLKGKSHREVSESLGIAVSTVEKHMAKAMKFLVLHLKDKD